MTGDLAVDGYAVLEGFVDEPLLAALRHEMAVLAPSPPGCDRPHNRLVPLRRSDAAVDVILAGERRRRAVAAVTNAADLRWISAYVSVRPPCTPALWWHQDWWCWSHPVTLRAAPPQVAVLVYLTETNERAEALR